MAFSRWRAGASALALIVCGAAGAYAVSAHLPALALVAAGASGGLVASAVSVSARIQRTPPAYDSNRAERARRWLGAIVDRAPTPLIGIEGERLTALNRAARTLFRTDELIAASPVLANALDGSDPRTTTIALDASERRFQVASSEVEGFGRIASLTDITAELRVAEAAATRDLMRVLSHEIMNGMAPIASLAASAAELVRAPDLDPVTLADAVDTIARRAAGLVRFTTGFRALARLPPPERTEVRLDTIFGDITHMFDTRWPGASISLQHEIAPEGISVLADSDQLAAALWALIDNAVEAIGAHGGTIRIEARRSGNGTSITVLDDGPGVDAHQAQAIFAPFFSTKAAGSGVGLSLARDILRAHGGDLELLTGNKRRGAAFRATLF